MSTSFIFDYNYLFNFYVQNMKQLPPITFWYFKETNKYQGTWSEFSIICDTGYIFQDNSVVYITLPPTPNADLFIFFNLNDPSRLYKNGVLADHLTFGVKDKKKNWIDMHLSIQQPSDVIKVNHIKCFLTDNVIISDLDDILCTYPKNIQLKTLYPLNLFYSDINKILIPYAPRTNQGFSPPSYLSLNTSAIISKIAYLYI